MSRHQVSLAVVCFIIRLTNTSNQPFYGNCLGILTPNSVIKPYILFLTSSDIVIYPLTLKWLDFSAVCKLSVNFTAGLCPVSGLLVYIYVYVMKLVLIFTLLMETIEFLDNGEIYDCLVTDHVLKYKFCMIYWPRRGQLSHFDINFVWIIYLSRWKLLKFVLSRF